MFNLIKTFLTYLLVVFIYLFPCKAIAQSSLILSDTVAFNDTVWAEVNYQGNFVDPLFKWVVTDSLTGFDSVKVNGLIAPGYKITSINKLPFVFSKGGNYDILVELPETTLRKRLVVWEPRSECNLKVKECEGSIVNGGFEVSIIYPNCGGQLNRACHWRNANVLQAGNVTYHPMTPDYFHRNFDYINYGTGIGDCPSYDIPFATITNQEVRLPGTNAYAGIYTWLKFGPAQTVANYRTGSYREYIQQDLQKPLIPGRSYNLKFWVSLAEISTLQTNLNIGFTSSLPKYQPIIQNVGLDDQSQYQLLAPTTSEGQLLTVSPLAYGVNFNNWVEISLNFIYTGTYPANYITIGNWSNDVNSNISSVGIPPFNGCSTCAFYESSYYLIDDIEVVEQNNACCNYDVYIDGRVVPQNISSYTILPGQKVLIEGEVNINVDFTFDDNKVVFGPYARINVNGGRNLTIKNGSHLKACTVMWDGIFAFTAGSQINVLDSRIDDAIKGIDVSVGTPVNAIGSMFVNNRVSIKSTAWSGIWNSNISDTKFTSGSLLPPYWGQRSYIHLQLDNAGTVTLSPVGIANRNTFSNSNIGIFATGTNLIVQNCKFQNIRDYGNGWSMAIASENSNIFPLVYTIVGDATDLQKSNILVNSDNGIYQNGLINYDILNNKFHNIKYKAINGVDNYLNVPVSIHIENNEFKNVLRGVDLVDFYLSEVEIGNNTFKNNIADAASYGIKLRNTFLVPDFFLRCRPEEKFYNVKILNNEITRFGRGIRSEQVKCLLVQENDVKVMAETPGLFTGISSVLCPYARIISNNIVGDVNDYRTTGIRQTDCLRAYNRCNTIKNCGVSFMFDGSVQNHSWTYNNKIYDSQNSFYLNNAEIGGQLTAGASQNNRWFGSITNHFYCYNSFGNNSPFFFQTGIAPGTSLLPSPLVSTFGGALSTPIQVTPLNTAPFDPAIFGQCSLPFSTEAGYHLQNAADSLALIQYVQSTLLEQTTSFSYTNEVSSLRHLNAYIIIQDNPWMMFQTPEITAICNSPGQCKIMYDALQAIEIGDYDVAKTFLAQIPITEALTQVLVEDVLAYIQLQMTKYGSHHIDNLIKVNDLLVIKNYAENCLYQYNQGTIWARLLIEKMTGLEISNVCEDAISQNNYIAELPIAQPSLNLYPNPASNHITVDLSNCGENIFSFTLFDLTGKPVHSDNVYEGNGDVILPHLANGLYVYLITNGQHIVFNGKIIINN